VPEKAVLDRRNNGMGIFGSAEPWFGGVWSASTGGKPTTNGNGATRGSFSRDWGGSLETTFGASTGMCVRLHHHPARLLHLQCIDFFLDYLKRSHPIPDSDFVPGQDCNEQECADGNRLVFDSH